MTTVAVAGEANDSTNAAQPPGALSDAAGRVRMAGRVSWALLGIGIAAAGIVWLLGLTSTIAGPLLGATIIAVVALPIVDWMAGRMHRGIAAALVLVGLLATAVLIGVLVVVGILDQSDEIRSALGSAVDKLEAWLTHLGIGSGSADTAGSTTSTDMHDAIGTLVHGAIGAIGGIASLAFGLSLAALSLFFILKDAAQIEDAFAKRMLVSESVGHIVLHRLGTALRGYFRGVTLVAAFNGALIGLGALLLGVPLAGTIAVVTFVTAYVPFIGAFVSGTFTVLLALGAKGTTVALIMLVIVILANGLLQNVFQPFAMGTALDLHPLLVLVVTIAAGCILGTPGLILAAPLLSAAKHISRDLRALRIDTG